MGDNLIDQPFICEQINLPYAKFAKKIDVKTLKRITLDVIDAPLRLDLDTGDESQSSNDKQLTFGALYQKIPTHKKATPLIVQNISAPISFVVLLHLANEQVCEL